LRAGTLFNNFETPELTYMGGDVEYDSITSYRALHVGIGYLCDISNDFSLDTYVHYFLSQQDRNDMKLSSGENIEVDAITSRRLKAGTRLTYAMNKYVFPYLGVAYEHEFDGQVNSTV
jgi:outer membrane autotransporter protein